MNKNIIIATLVLLVLIGISGYVFDINENKKSTLVDTHRMSDGSMMHNNDSGMNHMMSMVVESEKEFIEGMIPHHQEAIDTANEVLARGGTTPEIKILAENIIAAQEEEIANMKEWYESWYGVSYQDTGNYMPMMRDLSPLQGVELDRVFLEDMIVHHMGAIMMAQSVKSYVEHEEIEVLIEAIVATQSEEITQMREILNDL